MADPITQVVQSLGLVTAYGYAKSKGYTGTEEEFAEAAAAIGQGAATATAAAEAASEDAGTATTAAGTATTKAAAAASSATEAGEYKDIAENAAADAVTSKNAAAGSATSAAASAQAAATSEYNAGVAAGASSDYALVSQDHSEDSEAWAVGTKNGNDVPATAEQYNNNAKHYAEQASGEVSSAEAQATAAAASATAAAASAVSAEAWATGGSGGTAAADNNAKYYAEQAAASAEDAETAAVAGTAALANEASTFDASTAYTAGAYVLYDSVLYRFTADHAAGAWTGSDAVTVKIGSDITDLKSAFDTTLSNTIGSINKSSEYTWTLGRNYSNSGAYDTAVGFAITDLINVSPETVVINYSPEKGYNGKLSTMWVHEFNSSSVWQRRIEIKYGYAFTPSSGTAKIKIAYGYPSAQGVTITQEIVDTYFCIIALENTDLKIEKNRNVILISGNGFQNAELHTSYAPAISWVNKTINTSTGIVGTTTIGDRCCSPDMISVLGFNSIDWNATTPFSPNDALIYYYNLFGDYIGYEYKSKKPVSITNNSVAFIRIEFSSSSSFDASTFDGVLTLTSISNDIIENVNSISEEIPQIGKGAMHKSANLFDKTTATKNYYVQNSTGILQPLTDWYASDYIPIKPSTKYTMRYTNQGAFYTAGKVYISGFSGYTTSPEDNPNTVTSPATAAYIRVSVAPLQYNGYMLEEGESYTGFEEYGIYSLEREAVQKWIPSIVQSKNILPDLYHATADNPIRIKLLGDSITAGVGGTGYATDGDYIADTGERMNPDGYCWANLFKAYLESNFHCSVVNYAISGKNSGYYAQRATSMIEETDDIIICMLGTNDRGDQGTTTINTVYPNLETLLNRAKGVGAKFIPMACIPADLPNETTHTAHMEEVDFVINAFSADHNLEYVDVFTSMEWWCEYTGNPLSTYLDSGSLHPNDNGYLVMYKIITRALGIATKIDNADW